MIYISLLFLAFSILPFLVILLIDKTRIKRGKPTIIPSEKENLIIFTAQYGLAVTLISFVVLSVLYLSVWQSFITVIVSLCLSVLLYVFNSFYKKN